MTLVRVSSPNAGKTSPISQDDVVDGDDGQERREHLDEEQGHHPHPASPKSEAGERVGGERSEEHREERRRAGDDERVHVPARVGNVERLLLGPDLARVSAQDPSEVLEGDVVRNELRASSATGSG